jgi:hypothetical protein
MFQDSAEGLITMNLSSKIFQGWVDENLKIDTNKFSEISFSGMKAIFIGPLSELKRYYTFGSKKSLVVGRVYQVDPWIDKTRKVYGAHVNLGDPYGWIQIEINTFDQVFRILPK